MLTTRLIIFYSFIWICSICQGQTDNKCYKLTKDTLIIEKCYEENYTKPIIVKSGEMVINNTDSLHLVNNLRFRYYEKLRKYLNDSLDLTNDYIIIQYENLLKSNRIKYLSLLENCDSTSAFFNRFISDTDSTLNLTSKSLKLSQQSLQNAMLSLNEANELLEQERGIQFWNKFTLGIGGVGLGILIGLLVQ